MSVTVDLPASVLARLRAEAERRGVLIEAVIAELADKLPAETTSAAAPERKLAFIAAGASRHGITPRLDQLLADGFGRD